MRYWNRLEFEKVPFFQIYDPETETIYRGVVPLIFIQVIVLAAVIWMARPTGPAPLP